MWPRHFVFQGDHGPRKLVSCISCPDWSQPLPQETRSWSSQKGRWGWAGKGAPSLNDTSPTTGRKSRNPEYVRRNEPRAGEGVKEMGRTRAQSLCRWEGTRGGVLPLFPLSQKGVSCESEEGGVWGDIQRVQGNLWEPWGGDSRCSWETRRKVMRWASLGASLWGSANVSESPVALREDIAVDSSTWKAWLSPPSIHREHSLLSLVLRNRQFQPCWKVGSSIWESHQKWAPTMYLKNYGQRFRTLYRRQWSRLSPRKRNAKRQNGCLRRSYKQLPCRASLIVQSVRNLPAVQETLVQSLGQKDPLEKEMATHSRILAWKISGTQEPGGLQSMGSQRVWHDWATNTYLLTNSWKKKRSERQKRKGKIYLSEYRVPKNRKER